MSLDSPFARFAAEEHAEARGHLLADEDRYLMATYARQPLTIVSGHGCWVVDDRGRELLDLVAGIAVNILGHCPPAVRAALEVQSGTLVHASNLYSTVPQVEAARLLVTSAFPSRVFFCNSGAEAVEGAIKIARKWGNTRSGGPGIVCLRGAFHGRTMAALAATGRAAYLEPFRPGLAGFTHVEPDLGAITAALDHNHCAVLVEPVQGEGGVVPLDDELLRGIRRLCDERDALMLVDEVQSGMGRTGRMWAHQHAGITPDVMAVAKGLGGGMPVGAVLAAPRADILVAGDHGSTFGGNPLTTSVVSAVLRAVVDRGLAKRAGEAGTHLAERLLALREAGLPVAGVRGRGLMLAVLLDADLAPATVRAGLEHGVVVNATGPRAIRLVPPLTITDEEIDEGVRRIGRALADAAAA